ncbi:pentatricopeptide repeat-containing protein At2g40240, mitochondrial-like [Cicer arietinum]|uniref:Pentatricopeptide repeat-containing protein At2g40240, mitochondrial-like isoform X1 n=1 Tax=Cicer arietinum TaxID=3827 RepID=A0A1S2Z4V5_CICAR|nr:pentatricopeptide repeat-containing protein At2g40240, mitochondrial-like isoform X1 [Cicer arietinum]XP_004515110.1 pentatricopeptide repeat-containing protein At2g40240, mitochondrial-like isoform X1 [Cicer arietinum]XP_004515111.1 pentatricopeptide repeat-containing protein At2g40240, mitochondrial-like isoform X1 [Cicer arietinum]XP_012575651.1 pentatricopeptide repeat-containing protein At2g40240, mitochondrial-like isoform X1 [Cicer arietinum]
MSFLRKHFNISFNSLSILRGKTLTSKPFPDNPTATYYDNLAADVANSGEFDSLRDLLNKRIQDGFFNTKRTFSFITNTNFSPSFLNDVVTTLSHLNPGFTRRNAFDSLVTRLCKLHRVDDALHVIESMSRVGECNLSPCTFHPILNLLTREKSLDHARRVVESMARLGVPLDLTGHNFFLTAHCFIGDVNAAVGVLKKMEEEGFCADARTYDALVLGACRKGKVDCAMVVVRRMVDDGVPMLYSTHMYVIEGLLKMNCCEEAMKYVRLFSGKDKALDCELFGCLGNKLVGLNRVKEAMFVLDEMEKRGLSMGYKLKNFYEMNLGEENDGKLLKE